MEKLSLRRETTLKSLATLKESLELMKTEAAKNYHRSFRDSVIQRFKYTFDTLWKYCAVFLTQIKKTPFEKIGSPRTVFSLLHKEALITDIELTTFYQMLEYRNNTTHTYRESIAEAILHETQRYYDLMIAVTKRLEEDIPHA
ncbi:TPA: hypothetical protein DDZ86_00635 [Candidatus Dependentiae bacterium]|nr:MAG: Nucleotidyltransferase substrate binding protein, HI0074 family [candidate division TM6 bacterium GW2011_GWF2_43_87]HBL98130.1 hypothetical protein [Candidatus Dependentiae bacterium]